jgi:hypothetical protein
MIITLALAFAFIFKDLHKLTPIDILMPVKNKTTLMLKNYIQQ